MNRMMLQAAYRPLKYRDKSARSGRVAQVQLAFLIRTYAENSINSGLREACLRRPETIAPTIETDGVFPTEFPGVQVILPARSS